MSKLEMRMVEVCEGCGELVEHCLCDTEETCDGCCECCDCEEIDDETLEEVKLIESFAQAYEESDCTCGACLRNIMYDLYLKCKNIGKAEARLEIKDFIDFVEDKI